MEGKQTGKRPVAGTSQLHSSCPQAEVPQPDMFNNETNLNQPMDTYVIDGCDDIIRSSRPSNRMSTPPRPYNPQHQQNPQEMTLKTKVIAINAFQRTVIPWDMVETVLNQSRHGTGNIKRYSMQNVIEAQPLYDLQCNLKRATNEHVEEEIKVVDQFLRSSFNCSDVREYVDCTTKELTAALENAMMDNPTHLVLYINPIVSVGFDILLNINEKDKITIQKRIGMSPDWRNTSKETALNRDVSNLHLFPNIFTDILHPACGVSTAREISPMVLVIWDSSLGNSLPGRNLNSLQFFPVEQGSSAELYAMIQMLSQLNEILDEAASLATPGQQFRIDLVDLYTALANHCNDLKPLSMCNYAQAPRPSLHVSLADRFQVPFNPNPDLENQIVGLAVYIELRRWTTNIDDSLADWLAIRSQTKQFVTRIGFLWDKSTTSNWINSDALDKSTLMERLDSIIKHSCKMASQKKLRSMAIAVTSKFGNSLEIKTNGLSEGQTCLYTEIIKMVEAHPYVTNLLLLSHHSSGNYLIHSAIPGSKHNKLQKLPILPVIKKQSTEYICMSFTKHCGQLPLFRRPSEENYIASVPLLQRLTAQWHVDLNNVLDSFADLSKMLNKERRFSVNYIDYSGWLANPDCQKVEDKREERVDKTLYSSFFTCIHEV